MKFGCCVNMLATLDDPAGLRWLEKVAAAGFDYVELPVAEIMLLDDDAFDGLLAKLDSLGLRCESCNNFFPKELKLTGEERNEEHIQAYLSRALPRIRSLGAQTIVFGSAGAKNVPQGFPMDMAWEQVAEDLRIISAQMAAVMPQARVAIEPVCRKESNILLNYSEGVAMCKKVARENVLCLVDYYHMRMEDEPVEHLLANGDLLRHVHISSREGRPYPMEGDGEDYTIFFEALRRIGYDGCVSVEGFTNDFAKDARAALALFHKKAV